MAGIDKTYTRSYKEYKEFVDWARDKTIVFNYGKKVLKESVSSYIFQWKEEDFNGDELPIMNTPTWVDKYLYDNCPCKFVLDRLKEVYEEDTLKYKLVIGELPLNYKQNRKVKIKKVSHRGLRLTNRSLNSKYEWWVMPVNFDTCYNEELKAFVSWDMGFPSYTDSMRDCRTVKTLVRRLRKMYLPSGIDFILQGPSEGQLFKITVT